MFKSLADERRIRRTVGATGGPGHPGGIEVVLAKDYAPSPTDDDFVHGSDVPWMERFAADGGTAIISGNTKMLTVPHELLAIQRLGLTSVFSRRTGMAGTSSRSARSCCGTGLQLLLQYGPPSQPLYSGYHPNGERHVGYCASVLLDSCVRRNRSRRHRNRLRPLAARRAERCARPCQGKARLICGHAIREVELGSCSYLTPNLRQGDKPLEVPLGYP
jgi:hypothetical protein